ncbi:MAG: DUF3298 domain-containing protein [Terriglobia bacterium]
MRNGVCLFGILVGLAGSVALVAASTYNSGPVHFVTRKSHKEFGNDCRAGGPKEDQNACVWIDIEYPEVISASSEPGKAKINHVILQWVLEGLDSPGFAGDTIAESQEELFQDFIDREKDFRDQGDSDVGFWFERKVAVVYESANVLSLSRGQSGDTGGAHPNGRVDYANFRPSTGEPIRLRDIFKAGFEKSLNSIGEVRFRAFENLDPKASLRENNFWFPNDRFQLNDNFFIDGKGLTFQYNSYEVNCFACGAPSVFLSYSDLRNLIRPGAKIPCARTGTRPSRTRTPTH